MIAVHRKSLAWLTPGLGAELAATVLELDPYTTPEEALKMKVIQIEQNSEKWLKWRKGGVGASEAGALLGLNPWQTEEMVFQDKISQSVEESDNEHTRRGKRKEPIARKLYEDLMGWEMPPVCGVHAKFPFIRASLDGYREDGKLILELKCPSLKWQRHVLEEGIPDWYYAQVQHQLLVSGAPRAHFGSYCESKALTPAQQFFVTTVERDQELIDYLLKKLIEFWNRVQTELSSRC